MSTTNRNKSYEQKRWEIDVASHNRLIRQRAEAQSNRLVEWCDERIAEIELRWPQFFPSRIKNANR